MRDPVRIDDVECLRETEKALLCSWNDKEVWIPKSVIHDDSEVYNDGENASGTLVVQAWFAEKEGIE